MTKKYEIWSEGYEATGESGEAYCHGIGEGKDFKDACKNFAKEDKDFAFYFNENSMSYWGCKLFDNEFEARKSFG